MSEYEKHIGKLKRVDLSNYDNNIEKFFEEKFRKTFTELTEQEIQDAYQRVADYNFCRNKGPWTVLFQDTCYNYDMEEAYYIANGIVYETIEENELDPHEHVTTVKDNGDGTYDYFMSFYNGEICLIDCIEDELEKIV